MRQDMIQIGVAEDYQELEAIFEAFAENHTFVNLGERGSVPIRRFAKSQCRYVELDGNVYVEQNPQTGTEYARRAQQGELILWIIRQRDNQYIGAIDEGVVFMKDWVLAAKQGSRTQPQPVPPKQMEVGKEQPAWMKTYPF